LLADHPATLPAAPPSVPLDTSAPQIAVAADRARAATDDPTPEGGMVTVRPAADDPPAWFNADPFGEVWS
jgi:hypothetical protein